MIRYKGDDPEELERVMLRSKHGNGYHQGFWCSSEFATRNDTKKYKMSGTDVLVSYLCFGLVAFITLSLVLA